MLGVRTVWHYSNYQNILGLPSDNLTAVADATVKFLYLLCSYQIKNANKYIMHTLRACIFPFGTAEAFPLETQIKRKYLKTGN